jgi:hypothetical protein
MRRLVLIVPILALTSPSAAAVLHSPQVVTERAPVGGCQVFPSDNYWHADISGLAVDSHNDAWLSHMSTGVNLHPDFGPSYGDGPNYGIPITVVGASHPRVRVAFGYAAQSDRVRYPLGKDTRIEGGRNSGGDMHAIVVDKGNCKLYETWNTRFKNGRWHAGSGAVWSLSSNKLRKDGWTSADAAGLPILPGLLRWREVKNGTLNHAIRFTTDCTRRAHIWPARHDAGSVAGGCPPMGARFRLDASYSTHGYGAYAKVVIAAMKKYGLVLADNGSPWYFQGEQNAHWPSRLVEQLKGIPASRFVAVDTGPLMVDRDSAAVR